MVEVVAAAAAVAASAGDDDGSNDDNDSFHYTEIYSRSIVEKTDRGEDLLSLLLLLSVSGWYHRITAGEGGMILMLVLVLVLLLLLMTMMMTMTMTMMMMMSMTIMFTLWCQY